mmetsp:Transcript_20966/g.56183  ORF Transcript_20966/g.56183 Transcript_20966/m.56183 type:complete len:96 (+) Transcript_20966:152-439(+)
MHRCVRGLGFSDGCTDCWVGLAVCAEHECALPCTIGGGPSSGRCKRCSLDRCFPQLVACSGIPPGDLPPPELRLGGEVGPAGLREGSGEEPSRRA